MTKLEQIEKAVTARSPAEVAKFCDWFAESHAKLWDQQIAADAEAGRLVKFISEVKADIVVSKLQESHG